MTDVIYLRAVTEICGDYLSQHTALTQWNYDIEGEHKLHQMKNVTCDWSDGCCNSLEVVLSSVTKVTN
jgi:hypothetical protein